MAPITVTKRLRMLSQGSWPGLSNTPLRGDMLPHVELAPHCYHLLILPILRITRESSFRRDRVWRRHRCILPRVALLTIAPKLDPPSSRRCVFERRAVTL